MKPYIPLHLHTTYSLMDGIIQPKQLAKRLKELSIPACAITDHGWMGGIIEFYRELTKENIKPLLGCECYITSNKENIEQKTKDNLHMVIIAKDQIGLSLLMEELSHGAFNNFYYKPRIELSRLERLANHVVVTTACLHGVITEHLTFTESLENPGIFTDCTDSEGKALSRLEYLAKIFKEDLYLEIQNWPSPDNKQEVYNKYIIEIANKKGIPLIITTDAHFLTKEDYSLHEHVMASQLKTSIQKYRSASTLRYGPWFYVKSNTEMFESANALGTTEAYDNTRIIAEKCNVELSLNQGFLLPEYSIEQDPDYQDFISSKNPNG